MGLGLFVIILLIISLFLIPPDPNYIWVVIYTGGRYRPKRMHKFYLRFDEEYSEDYMPAFREARRLNRWHGYK